MVVKGAIQNGPLMEHTSYSGRDKVARVTANHATGWMVGNWEVQFWVARDPPGIRL
jgi:hypothetical protein